MKLQDICVSLELAKELKENGFKQDCLFEYQMAKGGIFNVTNLMMSGQNIQGIIVDRFSAPTVSELGEELPDEINSLFLKIIKMDKERWEVYYQDYAKENIIVCGSAKSFANAMAKMWLYLKKEGLLDD